MMTLLFGLCAVASAQTYTVDLSVPDAVPAGAPSGEKILAFVSFPGVADGYADTDVSSDWSYVDCAVRDGEVFGYFTATPEDFPSSFPNTATCSSQGYTLTLNIQPTPWPAAHDPSMDPSQGITLDLTTSGPYPKRTYQVFDLPTGPNYSEGRWDGRLSPSVPWPGVECGMAYATNGPRIWVRALASAPDDEGYCVLESASGVPHAIPLEIIR